MWRNLFVKMTKGLRTFQFVLMPANQRSREGKNIRLGILNTDIVETWPGNVNRLRQK